MFWISYFVTVALCSTFALIVIAIRFAISVIVRVMGIWIALSQASISG
jgi:hypothetical protein